MSVSRGCAVVWLLCVHLPLDSRLVHGDPGAQPRRDRGYREGHTPEQELLTKYLLQRLLDREDVTVPDTDPSPGDSVRRREDQDSSSSIVYPLVSHQRIKRPLQRLLDHAKANIDVIDFRNPKDRQYFSDENQRFTRQPEAYQEQEYPDIPPQSSLPSDDVPVFLPFPGTEPNRVARQASPGSQDSSSVVSSMPLTQLGSKNYYLGIFFKANWYKAEQYCRFHGMHLASINSAEEQTSLQDHIQSFGMGHEHFWTSGTDQAEEGKFFWMATGKPLTFEAWNSGEPNNFQYENGEKEHCLELWNRDGKGLRWNDTPCSFETFFVCEV